MSNKLENLEKLDLSSWTWNIDMDMDAICQSAVKVFLSESEMMVWFLDDKANAMDARLEIIAGVEINDKINPYIDINITSILSEEIKFCAEILNEGIESKKTDLESMKADMLSLINQIDGELLKYEQANTKD